jgi:hypothetical protein
MQVSQTCRNFIAYANSRNWDASIPYLNGLNMYEMLRALKALDRADITALRAALNRLPLTINAPRIEYAMSVVETSRLPATAPGDLGATGQVNDARNFIARPRSILRESIPKARVALHNAGVSSSSNTTMQARFGAPRSSYNQTCQAIENATLRRRMTTASVGPFRVTGLNSAVASLTAIMTEISTHQRLVYRVLRTAGMLCARFVRGSTTSISNHSWGTAIDLTIDGELDARGDNNVQFGLELIAPFFNTAGWYWGIDFRVEDSQHFEAGSTLVGSW